MDGRPAFIRLLQQRKQAHVQRERRFLRHAQQAPAQPVSRAQKRRHLCGRRSVFEHLYHAHGTHPLGQLLLPADSLIHIGPHEASALLLLMKQYHILAGLFQ